MAIALRRIRDRVRFRLRDTDAKRPTYSGPEYDQAIAACYLTQQARLPAPSLYTASAFTISAAADTFTLPATVTQWTGNDGGAEYAGDVRIQLATSGQFLRKRTIEEIDAMRNGSPTTALGIPGDFCLWEDKNQAVQGRCYPGASTAQVCNLFQTLSADDVRDYVGAGTDDMDDVEILFSRIAATALELYAAAELLTRMTDEDLKLRRMNPRVAQLWLADAERLLYAEASRRHDLEGVGRTMRWVS